MTHLPALIVSVQLLAKTAPRGPTSEIRTAIKNKALKIASQGVDAGLLTVCVVPSDWDTTYFDWPESCLILRRKADDRSIFSLALSVTAHHPGWLLIPTDAEVPTIETVLLVAEKLKNSTITMASQNGCRGYPAGFAAELFSELSQTQTIEDLDRIFCRYPVTDVQINQNRVQPERS